MDKKRLFQIVCVEDSTNDAELLKRAMQQMLPEAELLHFRNAETAQAFFLDPETNRSSIRMAVVDIQLPGMPGNQLISWLRKQPAFANLPIIALSGWVAAFKSVEAAQKEGATTFLLKPTGYNGYIDLVYHIHEECDAADAAK